MTMRLYGPGGEQNGGGSAWRAEGVFALERFSV
jgi:hypothetical protein